MESLTPYYIVLENLRSQALRLSTDAGSLANIFAEEANQSHREEEASQLAALRSSIIDRLKQEKRLELAGSYGHSKASFSISAAKSAAGIAIKLISKDKRLEAFSDNLLQKPSGRQPTFSNVLVSIGPKGIPDDAGVVSISQLARESNREESQVINEMKGQGCLLLAEEAFSLLIDKLINHVREGRVLLPVSREKLFEIETSGMWHIRRRKQIRIG